MNEWIPVVVGFGGLAILLLLLWLFPNTTWAEEAARQIGVRPTGLYALKTRRDRLKTAGVSGLAAPILLALAFAAYAIAEKFPGISKANWTAGAYGFGLFLLAAMAAIVCVGSGLGALIWRPTVIERERIEIAMDLANVLGFFADRRVENKFWPDFEAVRYSDATIEAIRARIAAEFPRQHPPETTEDAERLKTFIQEFNALAT
jgi:hypothetical protein